MFRESYRFYYLLGMSCLHTGDVAGAYSYLQRAITIDEQVSAYLGLAAVFLRRRQSDEALRRYLDVLDIDHNNRRAKRALQWLRAVETPEEVLNWFDSRRIRRLLPPVGLYIPRVLIVLTVVAALASSLFLFRAPIATVWDGLRNRESRQGSEYTRLNRGEDLLRSENGARYVLDESEIEEIFDRMRENFADHRDNLVRLDINRITLSNAAESVRQRAEYLRDFLEIPDFAGFRDGFEYLEVAEDPPLYHGTYVLWRGRVANLDIGDDLIRFDLLVGYETGQVLVGIVPATLDFAVLLRNNDPVELVGRIDVDEQSPVSLQVTSIRVLAPSEIAP